MSARQLRATDTPAEKEVEIGSAAIAAYNRLRAAVGGRIFIHPCRDGGILCEKWTNRARPTVWRIAADGTVLPDSPYNYALRTFVTAAPPRVRLKCGGWGAWQG